MIEISHAFQRQEEKAAAASAELAMAIAQLRERLKPASLIADLGGSVKAAVAPIVDPLIVEAKSASGLLALASVAATLLFGLGRSSVARDDAPPTKAAGSLDVAEAVSKKSDSKPAHRPGNIAKTVLLAGAAVTTGVILAAKLPKTGLEPDLGGATGLQIKRWLKDNSGDIIVGTVTSLGWAKGVGGVLAMLALATSVTRAKYCSRSS